MQSYIPRAGERVVITGIDPADAWHPEQGELIGCRCKITADIAVRDDRGWLEGTAEMLSGPHKGEKIEFSAFMVAAGRVKVPELPPLRQKDAWL